MRSHSALWLLSHPRALPVVARYESELLIRRIPVRHVSVAHANHLCSALSEADRLLVVLTPDLLTADSFPIVMNLLGDNRFASRSAVLVSDSPELPRVLASLKLIDEWHLGFDLAFEEVVRFFFGPLPHYLTLVCRPSQMRRLTGGSWWSDDALVVDEFFGHLLRVKLQDTVVLLTGLDEPYHLHIDRQYLLITHLGGDEVLHGRLRGGALTDLKSLRVLLRRSLRRPHGVYQGGGLSIIADTDNQRVLWTSVHLRFAKPRQWRQAANYFNFPCAVRELGGRILVADSDNHRLASIDPDTGRVEEEITDSSLIDPSGLCAWRDLLFVADEQARRLAIFQRDRRAHQWRLVTSGLLARYIESPLAVSVNRSGHLLITDRDRGCMWIFDLADQVSLGGVEKLATL